MINVIFTSIVYYKLQRFTERIPLNLAESSVEALYCVGYSPLQLLTLAVILSAYTDIAYLVSWMPDSLLHLSALHVSAHSDAIV